VYRHTRRQCAAWVTTRHITPRPGRSMRARTGRGSREVAADACNGDAEICGDGHAGGPQPPGLLGAVVAGGASAQRGVDCSQAGPPRRGGGAVPKPPFTLQNGHPGSDGGLTPPVELRRRGASRRGCGGEGAPLPQLPRCAAVGCRVVVAVLLPDPADLGDAEVEDGGELLEPGARLERGRGWNRRGPAKAAVRRGKGALPGTGEAAAVARAG
jgi:hypothetical protein